MTRTLTGLGYVALLLVALFLGSWYFTGLICLASWIIVHEFHRLQPGSQWLLFLAFPLLIIAANLMPSPNVLVGIVLMLSLCVNGFLGLSLITQKRIVLNRKSTTLISLFYIVGSLFILVKIPHLIPNYEPFLILSFLMIIWTTDSFAYMFGKKFGKRPLLSSVSPKKTVEGFVGGWFVATFLGFLFSYQFEFLSLFQWLFLSFFVSVLGALGDLVQSKFKRTAGVKDSGKILPGHGGLYDRMDSIIFAAPFGFLLFYVFLNVS